MLKLGSGTIRGWKLRHFGLAGLLLFAGAGGCRGQQSWPLWERYTQRFMDDQGRIIDHSAGDKTTSEGQSYAMFFALIDNDRPRFEKLLSWTQENLAGGDLTARLPAWMWGRSPSGEWKVLDANSASDSDLWIAYSLIEAGRLWHEPNYEAIGKAMAVRMAREEVAQVPGLGTTLLAGKHGFHPSASVWIVNPSYLPVPVLTRLAEALPQGPWRAVAASLGPLLTHGSGSGYAMDWVSAGSGIHPMQTPSDLASGKKDALVIGSYDAIRVYLWLGISDPATPGRGDLLKSVDGMATYLKAQTVPPEQVDRLGKVLQPNGPIGFSAALIPYLSELGMTAEAKAQTERVAAGRDAASGLYGSDPRYYDQNLVLFATGWAEERYRFDSHGRLSVRWK